MKFALVLALLSSVTSFASTSCDVKKFHLAEGWGNDFTVTEIAALLETKGYRVDIESPTAKTTWQSFEDKDFRNKIENLELYFGAESTLPTQELQSSPGDFTRMLTKRINRARELGTSIRPRVSVYRGSDLQSELCPHKYSEISCQDDSRKYSFQKLVLSEKKSAKIGHDEYYKNKKAVMLKAFEELVPNCNDLGEGSKLPERNIIY